MITATTAEKIKTVEEMPRAEEMNNLAQEQKLPLECQIKTQSEYELGKPITVTGIIRNAGQSTVWISPRNTFLEKNWRNCLSVKHNGSPVDYVGIAVTQMFTTTTESYLKIPAGESVEGQIDLSENYAITKPGDYEASFDLHIQGAFDYGDAEPALMPHRLQLTIITSDNAAFRITGDAAIQPKKAVKPVTIPAPKPLDSYPPNPKAPTFQGMNKDEEKDIFWAHQTAYKYILGALQSVQKSIDTPLYDDWFDRKSIFGRLPGWEERRKTVIQNFTDMATKMAAVSISYTKSDENCSFEMIAWTRRNSSAINLCSLGFNVHAMRLLFWQELKWVQTFFVIHEMSHAAGNTGDYMYLWGICHELPQFNPGEAVKNAQNYALFAMGQLGVPNFSPLETLNLKTGDKICLKAANGLYLNRVDHYSGHYIQAWAQQINPTCVFKVTITGDKQKKLLLQADTGWYCSLTSDGYIKSDHENFDESCYFTPGEFTDQNNETYLVLMAANGRILSLVDPDHWIMAAKDNLDPWCLFDIQKQN